MSNISRSVLFGKLNTTLYKTLENAYTFCRLRENSYVELVHWLHSLLQTEKTDIFCLINSFNLDEARVDEIIEEYYYEKIGFSDERK